MVTPAERLVARWASQARYAKAQRDVAIRALRAEGASLRKIAEIAEMGHNSIAAILDKEVTDG
jgi:predicted HTH domain antitoxin